jgi:hypothetical protein
MSASAQNSVRPSVLVAPPRGVSSAIASSTTRALQRLPDELLRAMVRGLRAQADDLAPGVLFRGHTSGGCAVGITLRELAPDAFAFGWLRFWLRQRWRRGIERDVARRFPHLNHLQRHFDEAVAELKEVGRDPQPAKAVGLWLAASAEAELKARRSAAFEKRSLLTRPARRAHPRTDGPVRARGRAARTDETQPGPEVSRWS